PRRLIVSPQPRAALTIWLGAEPGFAGYQQRLRDHRADAATLAGSWNIQAFQRRMILHIIRRLTVRHLPNDLAAVQVDRRNLPVRRPDDRKTSLERRSANPDTRAVAGRHRRRSVRTGNL